jgi:hypothetical protein
MGRCSFVYQICIQIIFLGFLIPFPGIDLKLLLSSIKIPAAFDTFFFDFMNRNIPAILAGLLSGFIVIALVESLAHFFYPPPDEAFATHEELKAFVLQLPLGAKLLVLAAWAAGSFAGGTVAAMVLKSSNASASLITGGILMVSGIMNLLVVPHPMWFWIVSFLIFIPAAYAGFLVAEFFRNKV